MRDIMVGKTMIVRFIVLGPANSVFSILGIQCTDSWYVAHTEDLLTELATTNSSKLVQEATFSELSTQPVN
jgi:phosphoenolpyruvate carboxykinase (GTP)